MLIALVFANILAWTSFLSMLFLTNPKSAGALGVAVLCISFTLGLISVGLMIWQVVILKKKN